MNVTELVAHFEQAFGRQPAFVARAPGRVNLIGEHTDYNDGFVLPMAIDRDVTIVGAPRDDRVVRLRSANFGDEAGFALERIEKAHDGAWSNYARGVAHVLQQAGFALRGFDGVIYGEVPIGSGLSSSAAIEMATLMAFTAAGADGSAPLALAGAQAARLAQRAENEFVGVNCGIMDQFISSLGKAGHALFIDCRSLAYELTPMPRGVTVLVVDTSAPRSLAASAYNERRAQCEQAARTLGAPALRDVSVETFEQRRSELPDLIARRAAHVIYENQRVLDAVAALRANDVAMFGRLMNQSHDSLRDWYEVSSKELDAVVEIARGVPGVYGARMTGAGFGGCAIALVDDAQAGALAQAIACDYPRRTGREPKVYACVASDGASWSTL
ncbi:MAG: galactokinase [Anaerolineae bacterium]|nr:galactokinase [Candidatus Roseilinea sp.]MDW8451378.1 galactokinase [Anaerolineae bacterium]